MKDRDCRIIQSKVQMWRLLRQQCQFHPRKSTSVIGEDTDLLLLLLYYASTSDASKLYFYSEKVVLQQYSTLRLWRSCLNTMYAEVFCFCLHSFYTKLLKCFAKMFSTPNKNIAEIEDAGCKLMVALFGCKPGHNLQWGIVVSVKKLVQPKALFHLNDCHRSRSIIPFRVTSKWCFGWTMVRLWTLLNGAGNFRTTV